MTDQLEAAPLIGEDDPSAPDTLALLARHLEFTSGQTPPEYSFALDATALSGPDVTFCSLRAGGQLLGIGALKRLAPGHAEIKSMHTAEAARGQGVGQALLAHLIKAARAQGCHRVSLETGTTPAYASARALYHRAGFRPCGPFAGYQPTEHNLFFTLELDTGQGGMK